MEVDRNSRRISCPLQCSLPEREAEDGGDETSDLGSSVRILSGMEKRKVLVIFFTVVVEAEATGGRGRLGGRPHGVGRAGILSHRRKLV